MLKLLFGRLLPGGLAIGLLTGALSPLQPALQAFAVAADALSGDASAGGVDMPTPEELMGAMPPSDGGAAQARGFFASLFAPKDQNNYARREIAGLAEKMKERSDERAKENIAKMGKKEKPAKAPKAKGAAKPGKRAATPTEPPPELPPAAPKEPKEAPAPPADD